jgi:hemerythrin superfamily protein
MSKTHPPAVPRTHSSRATRLVPVEVAEAVDAAAMVGALHQRVERQFAAYEDAQGSHARQYRALQAITQALATHVAVEDELLYPAVRDYSGRHDEEVARQLQQDHLLDLLLVELGGMTPSDRGFDAKVRVLMQVFRQHARDSEALVVPQLRRLDRPSARCSADGCWSGSPSWRAGPSQAGEGQGGVEPNRHGALAGDDAKPGGSACQA